jgi:acyl carrier protein
MVPSDNISSRVIATLRKVLPKKSREIDITSAMKLADLGMDSINFMEFLLALEEEFRLNLSGDLLKLKQVTSVQDAVDLVDSITGSARA